MSESAKKRLPQEQESPSERDAKREELVREVAKDAADRPDSYLRDTEVREGGE